MATNGHFHEGGKVGRSNATPTKKKILLILMSFRFGNDIFNTFEMPGVAYSQTPHFIAISSIFNQRSLHRRITIFRENGAAITAT